MLIPLRFIEAFSNTLTAVTASCERDINLMVAVPPTDSYDPDCVNGSLVAHQLRHGLVVMHFSKLGIPVV